MVLITLRFGKKGLIAKILFDYSIKKVFNELVPEYWLFFGVKPIFQQKNNKSRPKQPNFFWIQFPLFCVLFLSFLGSKPVKVIFIMCQ